jgi:hypothetical protein
VQRPQQERPGPFETEASKVVEDGLPRREIGWQIAKGGSWRAERRRSHRKWHAGAGLVACHVWAREEDGVAAFPTPLRFDCLGKWFSSIQFITREVLCPFPKHALYTISNVDNPIVGRLEYAAAANMINIVICISPVPSSSPPPSMLLGCAIDEKSNWSSSRMPLLVVGNER